MKSRFLKDERAQSWWDKWDLFNTTIKPQTQTQKKDPTITRENIKSIRGKTKHSIYGQIIAFNQNNSMTFNVHNNSQIDIHRLAENEVDYSETKMYRAQGQHTWWSLVQLFSAFSPSELLSISSGLLSLRDYPLLASLSDHKQLVYSPQALSKLSPSRQQNSPHSPPAMATSHLFLKISSQPSLLAQALSVTSEYPHQCSCLLLFSFLP